MTEGHQEAPDARPVVCQVVHTLNVGGGEVLAREIALAAVGEFRPVFALLDDLGELGNGLLEQGHKVEVIGRRPGLDLGCAIRLRHFFRKHGASLIHAHQYGPLFYSALARFPGSSPPILLTEHGRDKPDYRRRKRVWANRLLLKNRDGFVAVGKDVARALRDFEGLPVERIRVVYNGRDLTEFDPQRPMRDVVRSELGLPLDAFVVIQVARLNRLKDHVTALRAASRVQMETDQFYLLLVGEGEERRGLEERVDELGLRGTVRFLGSRLDVPRLLQAADVFLLTSISEGIPLTIIEAMATSLPCLATRVGGIPEMIVEGETGMMREAGDHEGLAQGLLILARDSELRRKIGEAGTRSVFMRHSSTRMVQEYLELYRSMTRSSLHGGPGGKAGP